MPDYSDNIETKTHGIQHVMPVLQTLNCRGSILDISKPLVMGIINITDDSFYSGSRTPGPEGVVKKAKEMIHAGASIIDLGAMSTRPGSDEIPAGLEIERIIPAVEAILSEVPEAILSIDTYRSKVAEKAIQAGASIINDISSGDIDPDLPFLALQYKCPYIAMHMQGRPKTMQNNPVYSDVVTELLDYFIQKLEHFTQIGLVDVIFDPGFGFGKTLEQNYTLLNNMEVFRITGKPILAGLSRKGMLWRPLNSDPSKVLPATIAVNLLALQHGATFLRVHDVPENVQLLETFQIIKQFENKY